MVNNIKTEIIYYCGPTDFEFEFNLCGSCQMRLLTSTANDKSSLLKALQRSIARSRVIIIVGNLNGEDGIISLVSKSIGYSCEKIDTNIYDVNLTDNSLIIKDSVPLITDNGQFGGCIIESGPQSMIFLTEDKKIRKGIMNNLVHGYIKDLSEYPIQAVIQEEIAPVTTQIEPQDDNFETEVIEDTEKTEQIKEIIEEDEIIPEEVIEQIEEHAYIEPEIDPYNINNLLTQEKSEEITFKSDNEPIYEDDFYDEPNAQRQHSNKVLDIFTLILSVILLLTLAFVFYSYIYLPLNNGISIGENFKNIFSFLLN